jgi:hypothetical protein
MDLPFQVNFDVAQQITNIKGKINSNLSAGLAMITFTFDQRFHGADINYM